MLLLLFCTYCDDGVTQHADAEAVVWSSTWNTSLCELFSNHQLLNVSKTGTAVFLWPCDCKKIIVAQFDAPFFCEFSGIGMVQGPNAFPILWKICVQKGANFGAVGIGLWWVNKIHAVTLCDEPLLPSNRVGMLGTLPRLKR